VATEATQAIVPRPAATVIVLRDGPDGIETFMVRRDPRSKFAADAFVFPGGTVQSDDLLADELRDLVDLDPAEAHRRMTERGGDPPPDPTLSLGLHLAAARELFEEAGILLIGEDADDRTTGAGARAVELASLDDDRRALQDGRLSFAALLAKHRFQLALNGLIYFSHWITPVGNPRRYDTRFFVGEMPEGQVATHCGLETVDGVWISPRAALARYEAGSMVLVSVTRDHLIRLSEFSTPAALVQFARVKRIRTVNARRRGADWDNGGDDW